MRVARLSRGTAVGEWHITVLDDLRTFEELLDMLEVDGIGDCLVQSLGEHGFAVCWADDHSNPVNGGSRRSNSRRMASMN